MSSSSSFSLGVSAAVFAPLVMTLGFLVWENTWTGSTYSMNLFKCCLASLWFLLVSIGTRRLLPTTTSLNEVFTVQSVGYLMLSSTLGILIGDWLWLEGLRLLGAKKVLVVDTLKPFFAAFLGWILLGETVRLPAIGGMMLTVIGVLMVSFEPNQTTTTTTPDSTTSTKTSSTITNPSPNDIQSSHIGDTDSLELPATHTITLTPVTDRLTDQEAIINLSEISGLKSNPTPSFLPANTLRQSRIQSLASDRQGYICSFLNVLLDTYGSVLTKHYGAKFSTWEISGIRFGFAGAVMMVGSIGMTIHQHFRYGKHKSFQKRQLSMQSGLFSSSQGTPWYQLPIHTMGRTAWCKVVLGVAMVNFLSPAMNNYSIFQIPLALALTLGSIGPLYALPLVWFLQWEKPTLRAFLGAALAVLGVVILSFCAIQNSVLLSNNVPM